MEHPVTTIRALFARRAAALAPLVAVLAACGGGGGGGSPGSGGGPGGGSSNAVALAFYSDYNLEAYVDSQGTYTNVQRERIAAFGGTPTSAGYTWSRTLGSGLPSTITIDPGTGVIGGTITNALAPGTYDLTVTVSDGASHTITSGAGSIRLFVYACNSTSGAWTCAPGGASAPYPQGPPGLNAFSYSSTTPESIVWDMNVTGIHANAPFGYTLPVAGGVPPYAFSLSSGSLPPGLSLDSSSGTILGTPTSAAVGNTYAFTVRVTDSIANTGLGYYYIDSIGN